MSPSFPRRRSPTINSQRLSQRDSYPGEPAAWRIAGIGVPIWLESHGKAFKVEASAVGPNEWLLTGALNGKLHAELGRGKPQRITLDGRAVEAGTFGIITRTLPPPSADTDKTGLGSGPGDGRVTSPMPGKIVKVAVKEGDAVEPHALLLVLEAMKMEHRIEASAAATVKALLVKEGDIVSGGAALVELS